MASSALAGPRGSTAEAGDALRCCKDASEMLYNDQKHPMAGSVRLPARIGAAQDAVLGPSMPDSPPAS